MSTGTALTAADLRAWAIVYDPVERRMYEVIALDANDTIAVLLDAGQDYDPLSPVAQLGNRRVEVRWAAAHLTLVRKAPEYAPVQAARLPETAGTFRR